MTEPEKDRFGLKVLTTTQEVVISFTLFVIGVILVISTALPLIGTANLAPGVLGLIILSVGYLFAIESIRELEEKDHFLSRKLGAKS